MPYLRQMVQQSFDPEPSAYPIGYGPSVLREYEIPEAELKTICAEIDQANKERAQRHGSSWYRPDRSRFFVRTNVFSDRKKEGEGNGEHYVYTGLISSTLKYVNP